MKLSAEFGITIKLRYIYLETYYTFLLYKYNFNRFVLLLLSAIRGVIENVVCDVIRV